jgi:hypothetical protein
MSEVREYRPKHSVVKAMRFAVDFDLDFLEPNEQVRLSSNGKSILIIEKDTDRCIAFVDPGTWLVRKGAYIGQFDDEEFQRIYEEQP